MDFDGRERGRAGTVEGGEQQDTVLVARDKEVIIWKRG